MGTMVNNFGYSFRQVFAFLIFTSMRENKEPCDLILIASDNKTIPIHREVLIESFSPYFIKINADYDEEECFEVHVPICFTPLEIIVDYFYTGKVRELTVSELKTIYEISKEYGVPYLEQYSTLRLIDSLTMDVSLEYFRHSIKNSIQNLEDKCLQFIAANTEEFFNKYLESMLPNELIKIMEVRHTLIIEEIDLYRHIKKWIFMNYDMRKCYIEEILCKYVDVTAIPDYTINFYKEVEKLKEDM